MLRNLTTEEIDILEKQGCSSSNWELVIVDSDLDLKYLVNVRFDGEVTIYKGVKLINIPGGISGCVIKENVLIENVASVEYSGDSAFGVGTEVSVLDETGSRAIPIFPGLSSQIATLLAREPEWRRKIEQYSLSEFIDSKKFSAEIGENAVIKNSGPLKNVFIDREVTIEGASYLENGALINNSAPGKNITHIGYGVEADNFILEDGRLESKASVSHCYIGQGAELAKGFSAHDSLLFANCSMENGEVHSILAGPYTVSMHKGTLLIGCQTSFMNAGSSTNQSNHMYKLGPIHWGVLERGVKTASGSYVMFGAKIGAFSLLMGQHKTHPDTSEFPFSYLFGDDRGNTLIVPGIMLRSCGLTRDEQKWPNRDRRLKPGMPLYDHITFNVLNPWSVGTMLKAIKTIDEILKRPADGEEYMRYKGLRFTRAALERAKSLYSLAIFKYLSQTLPDGKFPENDGNEPDSWLDLGGQVIPSSYLRRILECDDIQSAQGILNEAFENFNQLELTWIGRIFDENWRNKENLIVEKAKNYDRLQEDDRQDYLEMLARENEMLRLECR